MFFVVLESSFGFVLNDIENSNCGLVSGFSKVHAFFSFQCFVNELLAVLIELSEIGQESLRDRVVVAHEFAFSVAS